MTRTIQVTHAEMLNPDRVTELWGQLEPLLSKACAGNEVARDISAADIYRMAVDDDEAVVLVALQDAAVVMVLVFQFRMINGHKTADIVAMAGQQLMSLAAKFWPYVLQWLKANNVEFLDTYVRPELANFCKRRLGFNLSCTMLRMTLGDTK